MLDDVRIIAASDQILAEIDDEIKKMWDDHTTLDPMPFQMTDRDRSFYEIGLGLGRNATLTVLLRRQMINPKVE